MLLLKNVSLALLMLSATFSCEKSECSEGTDTKIFQLGKDYCLNDNQFFRIDSILDSRCPKDVICVWEGKTDIYFKSTINAISSDIIFSYPNNNRTITFDSLAGYTMSIDSVTPYPKYGTIIDQNQYRVHATVIKK